MKENKFMKEITQIGLVVDDWEKAVEGMRQIFGVEPGEYGTTPPKNKFYYGEPEDFAAKMAFYHFANIDIELVEPLRGRNIWSDFLQEGNYGLHHLRFSVSDYDGTVSDMQERGIAVSMEGESVRQIPGLKWAYFNTENPLGWIIEIFNEREKLNA